MKISWYRKWCLVTIIAVYILILVGAWVRSSGSGMGCPDWPKCFGRYIPPTSIQELPPDYQQKYAHVGYDEMTFNVVKTWTEYLNRVLGVLVGIFILITFIISFSLKKQYPSVFYYSCSALILVVFQGWLGSKVVALKLVPWIVTVHMGIALAIVALLIAGYGSSVAKPSQEIPSWLKRGMVFFFVIITLQIILGTHVREEVDHFLLRSSVIPRTEWIEKLGIFFTIHKIFSWVAFAVATGLLMGSFIIDSVLLKRVLRALFAGVFLEMIVGIVLVYRHLPPLLQPVHLVLATGVFGLAFFAIYFFCFAKKKSDSVF